MTRADALRVVTKHARARHYSVDIPLAIRDALLATRGTETHHEVLTAVGVLTGCPLGEPQLVGHRLT